MSPTMTEGGIAAWKVQEGQAFSAGDVLLEIETDKATIDVETQEDGVLGKILKPDGAKNVQVGELIGILVDEGDDLGELSAEQFGPVVGEGESAASSSSSSSTVGAEEGEPTNEANEAKTEPVESSSSSSSAATGGGGAGRYTHAKPLAPSVARLLASASLDPAVVAGLAGSGRGGYLTKGDVLKALGRVATVWGSQASERLANEGKRGVRERFALPAAAGASASAQKPAVAPAAAAQDAPSLRRAVLAGLVSASSPSPPPSSSSSAASEKVSFDDVLAAYKPTSRPTTPKKHEAAAAAGVRVNSSSSGDGVFGLAAAAVAAARPPPPPPTAANFFEGLF